MNEDSKGNSVKSINDAINRIKQAHSELSDAIHTGETIMDRVCSTPESPLKASALDAGKEMPPQNLTEELQRLAEKSIGLCGKLGSLISRMDRTF